MILCTGNSCRSIMAEALINHYLGDRYLAISAGVSPSTVNPLALQALAELGISPAGYRSKSVTEFLDRDDLDLVITICDHAKETCLVFIKPVRQIHIGIIDPAPYAEQENAMDHFRSCRQEIMDKVVEHLNVSDYPR